MLDIDFIRDNEEILKEAARKKHIDVDIDELLKIDEARREQIQKVEKMRAEQNKGSDKIAQAENEVERQQLINEMKDLKEELGKEEEKLKGILKDWKELMLKVPNIPDISVPEGEGEEDNKEIDDWGQKPTFDFKPQNHIELLKRHDMADFERGTKVHGFRGYFLKNEGAELQWALWNYAREFYSTRGFTPIVPPAIVRKEYFYGTGHLPSEAEDLFQTQDGDYLSGTAEVPMMAYHAEEILDAKELPKRYLAFSPCYRREAGSHGKDTKGLVRVHEFFKLEQLILCEASHERSVELHEEINKSFEEFLESLELPYRQLLICGGDLSASKVKQYDTEVWIPSQDRYRELSSASYYHDFQTRRFNIKYKEDGKKKYVHSLNGTAVATPRIIVAIVENYQNEDGSITVPEVLRPYMDVDVIGQSNPDATKEEKDQV